jgi:hypothetical protein|tara:strand:- start:1296 stop:1526 length:231 start_codon:yes stop_codon:yes gene_type:complete
MGVEEIVMLIAGPAGGLAVAVYFLNRFMAFQKETIMKVLEASDADRELFKTAVGQIDVRLSYIEKLVEHSCKSKEN